MKQIGLLLRCRAILLKITDKIGLHSVLGLKACEDAVRRLSDLAGSSCISSSQNESAFISLMVSEGISCALLTLCFLYTLIPTQKSSEKEKTKRYISCKEFTFNLILLYAIWPWLLNLDLSG